MSAPTLKPFDPFLDVQSKTDAFGIGGSVILEQTHLDIWHVIAYESRMLDKHKKNTSNYGIFFICYRLWN